jgi:kinesin family protein 2/24
MPKVFSSDLSAHSCMFPGLQEMKLLAEVDQPGSLIDNYVTQLNFVLSRKAAGLVSLQARLARFQHRLKEQEILSRKRVPR